MTYAAAVVAVKADRDDLGAAVTLAKDGKRIDAPPTVGDMLKKDL